MIFSERKKLEKEYYNWVKSAKNKYDIDLKDNPFNVISFLEIRGLLKSTIEINEGNKFNLN